MVRARAHSVGDHLLEPADGRLSPGPFRIPGGCLPGSSAVLGDARQTSRFEVLKMAVPLRAHGLDRFARHGRGTRWHNDGDCRVARGDRGGHAVLVVGTVGGERRALGRHLIEQGADLGAVDDVFPGQCRRDDLAGVGIQAYVQSPPGPSRFGAVFLDQPLPYASIPLATRVEP